MRVLTDWATGAPPCVGWWLIRPETSDTGGSLRYWTGEAWKYSVKDTWSFGVGCIEWRGLAFDPESAAIGWDIANGCSGLIITEYAP